MNRTTCQTVVAQLKNSRKFFTQLVCLFVFTASIFYNFTQVSYAQDAKQMMIGNPAQINAPGEQTSRLSPAEQELLAQLNDIVLPQEISLLPRNPIGWLLVAIVLFTFATIIIFLGWQKRVRAYRNAALKELTRALNNYYEESKNFTDASVTHACQQKLVCEILILLKRTYYSAYPTQRTLVASSYGQAFITKLQVCLPLSHREQNWAKFELNDDLLYRETLDHETHQPTDRLIKQLEIFAQKWIRYHQQQPHKKETSAETAWSHNVSV